MALIVLMLPVEGHAKDQKEYISPDGRLRALVIPVGKDDTGIAESRIEIRKISGELVFKKDYSSTDGNHGWVVSSASWTNDSRFFVFGMYSSGGHQPWHSPVDFYSRRYKRVFSLDKYVGTITDSTFQVSGSDIVKVITQKKGWHGGC